MARFVWSRQQADGRIVQFGVGIVDGLDVRHLDPGTILSLSAGIIDLDNEGAEQESEEDLGTDDTASAAPAPKGEPGPTELGVPRYPGASFDGRNSSAMSSDEEHYFIYHAGDSPEKVVAFYERELRKKGTKTEGGVLFTVKGKPPFPDLGVIIQENAGTYPPAVKTIITVRRGAGP